MKRLLSVVLSILMAFLSVSQGFYAFAQENDKKNLYNFANELSEMVRENVVDTNESEIEEKIEDEIIKNDVFYGSSEIEYSGFSDDAFETQRLIVKSKKSIDYKGAIDCVSGYNNLYILQYNSVLATKLAYKYYLSCDYIDYVEPDIILSAQDDVEVPEINVDGYISDWDDATAEAIEWVSEKIGFSSIEEKLKEMINDDYVLVAVIDSGVDTDHEYFENRLVYSDYNGSSSGERNSVEDDYGHGTHVTGIIVGNTLDNVKIKPYKVLNDMGNGSLSSIAVAVDLAVADGADIINMSLAAQNKSQTMIDSVNNAVANDVNVVAAAGNKGVDLDNVYITPACIDSAITVSATDKNDKLASFSNYDSTIDIAAPGQNIKSCYLNNTYTSMSGTSMSAPQVSAGLAILQTVFLDKPADECEEMIKDYAIAMSELENHNYYGAGLLYLEYLLDGKPTTADPVFSVDSCTFTEPFNVSISCPDKDATIYYIIYNEGNLAAGGLFDGNEYTSPIKITTNTKIAAVAIGKGANPSSIVTAEYERHTDSEEQDFEINASGEITDYYGSNEELVIPEIVQGKVVNGIASGAFKENSFIKKVILPETVSTIKSIAFKDCKKLESISGSSVSILGAQAFIGCENLVSVDFPTLEGIGDYAFSESGIKEIHLESVTDLGSNVFNGCDKLETAILTSVENINIGTFRDCIALKTIDVSSATKISANAFRNTGLERIIIENIEEIGNYAFADNTSLKGVSFPNVNSTGAYVFQNCSSLKFVSLPKLEQLNSNTFNGCSQLSVLYLPSTKVVVKNAFAGSSVQHLKFDCVETIKSLPDTLVNFTVPSTLEKITSIPSTDFKVYGHKGTYAEEIASENNKEFFAVPAIIYEPNDNVDAESGFVFVYAQGFNCTYQWYKNDSISNENGVPIEGAIHCYYKPSRDDKAEAYYCVITSNDGISVDTVTTKAIVNAPEYKDADYTEFYELYEVYQQIDKTLYKEGEFDEVDALFQIDVTQYSLAQQALLDEYVKQIKDLINSAELNYILCDVNGDNEISIVDARLVLKAVLGDVELDMLQTLAADINGDGEVSIADSRAILKMVLDQ